MTTLSRVLGFHGGVAALLLGSGAAFAQAAPASQVEQGRQLFMSNGCYACHGTVGQGGERSGAPKLAPDPYPLEAFKVFVRGAKETMPRFDPKFVSDEQVAAIHAYLSSIQKGPAAKDIPALQGLSR
jgi:ubiquinol-cytochrome c reductase cytochrome c subunit